MIEVTKTASIDLPIEKVFEFIADPANETSWQDDMVEAGIVSEGPIGVGSEARFVQRFLGLHFTSTTEITVYDPPHAFGFRTTSGPVEFQGQTRFEAEDGGTRVTFLGTGETHGLYRLAEPLIRRRLDKTLAADLVKLKNLLEGRVATRRP